MSTKLTKALKPVTDEATDDAKSALLGLIGDAKASTSSFVQSTAVELEEWIVAASKGELSEDEFKALVDAQTIVAKSFVLRQSQIAQQKAEKLTVNMLELAVTKILPVLIAAI